MDITRARSARRLQLSAVAVTAGSLGASLLLFAPPSTAAPAGNPATSGVVNLEAESGGGHSHAQDAASKNALSRDVTNPESADLTSPAQRAAGEAVVAAQRAEKDPKLTPLPAPDARALKPTNRYELAGGCYALKGPGGWVAPSEGGYAAAGDKKAAGTSFWFQATDLGSYLIWDDNEQFLRASGGKVGAVDSPSEQTVWAAAYEAERFTFAVGGDKLRSGDPLTTGSDGSEFKVRATKGCATWPEIGINIEGQPFKGVSKIQEVRGTIDAHTHGMAFEFLGGKAHCGRPWSPYGVEVALTDCPDHEGDGAGALLENLTRTGTPVGTHDPVGWPTFNDWPAPDSLTHEGTYYKWMERAYAGGLRLFVNLLVENNQLCTAYPLKQNSCDDMDSVRLQAQRMREFERYIDAQSGGPGKGWYRIVTSPFQARKVINKGKLAVIMGIETSVPFGCSVNLGNVAECTQEQIETQLDEVYDLGVRQMELVNKFDNALSGVAGDGGALGVAINGANFNETGSFWDMKTCTTDDAAESDREQYALPDDGGAYDQQDALFGAIGQLFGVDVPATPLYPPAPHCNAADLTSLGEATIRSMAKRNMIFDPDHMSVKSRESALDVIEDLDYSGVISSHSWSTPKAYERILGLGGTVYPYAGDSSGFVSKWRSHLAWADERYYFGFGYGADINGLGAQGDPRADAATNNPVTYPFTGMGQVQVNQQVSGEQTYDINTDGVAHYGLYPDWLQDLENQAGPDITTDMSRGAEAYLQMWERAEGVDNDSCRDARTIKKAKQFRTLKAKMTIRQVLLAVGAPHKRLGDTLTWCATARGGFPVKVKGDFGKSGRLKAIRS